MSVKRPNVLIVGLGGAGIAIVHALPKLRRQGLKTSVADIDSPELTAHKGRVKICLDRGTSSKALADMFAGSDILILTGGLGGRTGSNAMISLAKQAQVAGKKVAIVTITPFPFEEDSRKQHAEHVLGDLADQVQHMTVFHGSDFLDFIHPSHTREEIIEEIDFFIADTVASLAYSLQELGHDHDTDEEEEDEPRFGS